LSVCTPARDNGKLGENEEMPNGFKRATTETTPYLMSVYYSYAYTLD
jgi:hypothetical protein